MKYLIYLSLLLTNCVFENSFGQKTNDPVQPFTVLFAQNVTNSFGQPVKSLDGIMMDEILVVQKGGAISLVHVTGFPVEIERDTTLVIKSLHSSMSLPVEKNRKESSVTFIPLSLSHLFISNGREGRKHKLNITGSCADCGLQIIYPPRFGGQPISYSGDACIKWMPTATNMFTIKLYQSKKVVRTYRTSKPELTIEQLTLLEEKDAELFLVISDSLSNWNSARVGLRKFRNSGLEYPYPCEIKTASAALIAGLYLELSQGDYLAQAENYFILASQLSDREFFKVMLANFRDRRKL